MPTHGTNATMATRAKKAKLGVAAEGSHDSPRSPLRTLKLLEHLSGQQGPQTLSQLSEALQTPKSSLLALLRALVQHGYLSIEHGAYVLGPSAHRMAVAITPAFPLSLVAKPVMRELAAATGETALLATLDSETARAVYVDMVESAQIIRYTVPMGTSRPLYCTAAGRLLLAFQPDPWIEQYLSRLEPVALTPVTVIDRSVLLALLRSIRESGVSTTIGEYSSEVAGVAAAVLDQDGNLLAALTLGAPIERARANLDRLVAAIRQAANGISLSVRPRSFRTTANK
jgi:IclR family transcriptional regulator, acetate operon repressor